MKYKELKHTHVALKSFSFLEPHDTDDGHRVCLQANQDSETGNLLYLFLISRKLPGSQFSA